MRISNKIRKIVEEYSMFVDGLDFLITGRVLVSLDTDSTYNYSWEISHYCKGTEAAATAYTPSDRTASTIEEARKRLMIHMETFTTIGVEPNQYF